MFLLSGCLPLASSALLAFPPMIISSRYYLGTEEQDGQQGPPGPKGASLATGAHGCADWVGGRSYLQRIREVRHHLRFVNDSSKK